MALLEIPGQEDYTQVLGQPVRYFRAGAGPPVVLLHGLGEAALVWYGNLAPLGEGFTVYAPDLLGHGRSGRPRLPYTADLGVAFVTGFLEALGLSAAHLIGNSLGGLLAVLTGLNHPGMVRSLVLEDSLGLGREIAGFLQAMSLPLIGEVVARPTQGRLRQLLGILFYDQARIPDGLVEALHQERTRPGNKEAMLRMLRAGVTVRGVKTLLQVKGRLPSLTIPTLVLWGRQDRIFPVAHGEAAAQALPQGRLHVFEECGHWPHMERREEYNTEVLEFLKAQELRAQS